MRLRGVVLVALGALSVGGCKSSGAGGGAGQGTSDAAPVAAASVMPVAPIGHAGRWLTDAEGRVLLVHGVNVVNKEPPYSPSAGGFSDSDATWLAANGFRVVRVGILATGLMPTPGVIDSTYIDDVVGTVTDLAQHDVYSLIDLHQDGWGPETGSDGFPPWMTLTDGAENTDAGFPLYYENNPALQHAFQSFWDDAVGPDDAGLQEDYAAMFGAVAKKLAGEPHVLGYDLFNEPWPGTTWDACLNDPAGCPSLDTGELGPAYAKALAAIRAAGDQHLVFGEPFVLFNFGTAATSIPVPGADSKAGMAFHVYPLVPTASTNVVDAAVTWASETGGALLNTEWGATEDRMTLTTLSSSLDTALVPWIFWSFCCELVPSFQLPPGDANLVSSTASVLVEAYPLAVAGTPQAYSNDPVGKVMSFTWSTARTGGGAFDGPVATTFEVPPYAYPTGYSATVTGGRVTSAACATHLTVAADPGATTVTVNVAPGGTCD
jgi:endoglycosylceramidase